MNSNIEFKNVSFGYDKAQTILNNISFSISKGESVGLVGANGTGKSTMMRLILGLETGNEGSITVCGMEMNKKNLAAIRSKVGYVMQDSDNQMFMSTVYKDICFGPRNYGYSEEDVEARAKKAIELTGIAEIRDKAVYKLSCGEKKLAAIATILAMEPETVIMDEPESSLDPMNRRRLIDIIKSMDRTKIIVSHDLDFIWETTDRLLLLGGGEIKAFGNTKDILSDKCLLNKYSLTLPNCAIIKELEDRLSGRENE